MSRGRVMWYWIVLNLARFVFFLMGRKKGVGMRNIPRVGPLIVAPVHISHLDPPVVACALNRRLRFMAKEELFKGWFGKLISSVGAFPVKRGEGDTESIRKTIQFLNEGDAVLIFPEGTRGDGVHLQPINRGVIMLAKRTGAQVLPVGIIGTHRNWPKGQKKPKRGRIIVAFGEPFTYQQLATGENEKENREVFAAELSRRLQELCARHGLVLKSASNTESPQEDPLPEPSAAHQHP